jgi:nucleoside-diphosphate-sugar epimerase
MSLFSQFTDCEDLLIGHTRIIHVGSGAEYGSATPPFSEGSAPMNLNEYGRGKLEETKFFSGLANNGLDTLVLRPSIIFGASQKGDMLVPSVLRSLREGREPNLREPLRVRDFLYEKDFARAVIFALTMEWRSGQIFNLGSGSPVRVQEFVAELSRMIGLKSDSRNNKDSQLRDLDLTPEMDISLIRKELGWEPRFDFKSAIADLVRTL